MDLDLGEKPVANVKIGASTYKVEVPSVKQAQKFKEELDAKGAGTEFEAFANLMELLGLPKDVSENLSIAQITKLSEGLLGGAEKSN